MHQGALAGELYLPRLTRYLVNVLEESIMPLLTPFGVGVQSPFLKGFPIVWG